MFDLSKCERDENGPTLTERAERILPVFDQKHTIVAEETAALIRDLLAEVERLSALADECADSLADELNVRYQGTLDYPSQKRKYDRDMEVVNKIRGAFPQEPTNGK